MGNHISTVTYRRGDSCRNSLILNFNACFFIRYKSRWRYAHRKAGKWVNIQEALLHVIDKLTHVTIARRGLPQVIWRYCCVINPRRYKLYPVGAPPSSLLFVCLSRYVFLCCQGIARKFQWSNDAMNLNFRTFPTSEVRICAAFHPTLLKHILVLIKSNSAGCTVQCCTSKRKRL